MPTIAASDVVNWFLHHHDRSLNDFRSAVIDFEDAVAKYEAGDG